MWRVLVMLAWLSPVALMGGCGGGVADSTADQAVVGLMNALQAGDTDQAMTLYSAEFYKGIPAPQWRDRLEALGRDLGPVDRYLLRSRQADTRYSGKFYVYEYETVHARGRALHLITLLAPVDRDGLEIVAHRITVR